MKHTKTQTDWEVEMCEKILPLVRDSLYLDFRYLDSALNALTPVCDPRLTTFATDGAYLRYSAEQVLRLYPDNPLFLQRAYMHTVLHCIFGHLFLKGSRDPQLWNLSCDIAAEWLIDHLERPSVKRVLSGLRLDFYRRLEKDHIPVTAANIYDLAEPMSEAEKNQLVMEFIVDDHRFWPAEEKLSPSQNKLAKKWEQISRRSDQELSRGGSEEGEGAASFHTQIRAGKARRTYADFLRKFTVLHEEMHIDQDAFDPGYYAYGLRLYKNMPLIEHPESREVSKILQFVIVLDTSYSTSGDLVRRFLRKTFDIIRERDHFFRESRIHILQADSRVLAHEVIKNKSDLDRVLAGFNLTGGGSTDFRPAFAYIDQMIAKNELPHLKGVLYFTDGRGTYPRKAPAYRTAFVFIDEEPDRPVPAWAMKIQLQNEDYI